MSKNKVNASSLSIEEIEKGVDYNKAIIKNLFIFYAIAFPICLATTILMFVVGDGAYFRYGYTLAIMCVLCTVYVVMAYVRRKRVLNELVRQQSKKKKN
ncbi:MAG: hypothetical protein E7344_00845 [Clostridiales bacterium]|nr:hypothetical protein [Clostridiales bacterium]